MTRQISVGSTTNEWQIVDGWLSEADANLRPTKINGKDIPNPAGEDQLGKYRDPESRRFVTADVELHARFAAQGREVPSFLEAGPRARLCFDPRSVRAAIATTGGVAPGLNCVIHSIVKRHCDTYGGGMVYGVNNSFTGLSDLARNMVELAPTLTETWIDQGGSKLGNVRSEKSPHNLKVLSEKIAQEIVNEKINILYVIGGDGSMAVANRIARLCPDRSIFGVPKTMDNDILWVWKAFGFDTAVEAGTDIINRLKTEAETTRRVAVVELFGAESGFVAANAALASGHVDAVLIPEVVKRLSASQAEAYLKGIVRHVAEKVRKRDTERRAPHALIVVAEGVATGLEAKKASLEGTPITKQNFVEILKKALTAGVVDAHDRKLEGFVNQPRHCIRAVPANAYDKISCERLGALAVDNALAGYTDCLVSQWLTEFVLVPLKLVINQQKSIPIDGMFWKQVIAITGQPLPSAEG